MSERNEKLKKLKEAIEDLEGEYVPYNIIVHQIKPLMEWLKSEEF